MAKRDKRVVDLIGRVISDFTDDQKAWDEHADMFRKRWRAYRGTLEPNSEAAAWTNKQHPAVIFQALETISANLLDPNPKWRLRPRPIVTAPEEVERLHEGAKANELLLNYQLSCDHWAEKQRSFDLQALICGLTVSKQSWVYREGDVRYQQVFEEPVHDSYGYQIGTMPRLRDVSASSQVLRDDPTMEVVDVFDWFPHRSACSLDTCDRITHRVWYTFAQLKEMEANGRYGVEAGGEPIDLLKDTRGPKPSNTNRGDLFELSRPDDLIEVLECWTDRGRRVVTVANRTVLLEERDNPYWFDYLDHRFPFVICSGTPDPFRIAGVSEVEVMLDLQKMLWTLMNQRLDVTQLIASPPIFVSSEVEDIDDLAEFEPGAVKQVPPPVEQNMKWMEVDVNLVTATIAAEQLVRKDIQDISGASVPFQPGVQKQSAGDTATEAMLIATLAQKRISAKKQQFLWAKKRIGEQWCALNQQYVKEERLIPVVGLEGAEDWFEIRPEMLQGVYVFETEMADDSLLRQERRAEHQAKLQVLSNIAPVMAAIGQPLNLRAAVEDYLDTFDATDMDRYFTARPQQLPMEGQSGQPNPAANGGVTNPTLAAGPSSPSNEASMSPVVDMQRMLAGTGGVVNQ